MGIFLSCLFVCLFLGVAVHSSTHYTYFLFLLSRHFLGVWCVPWAPSMKGEWGSSPAEWLS